MRLLLVRHGQTHGNTIGALDTAFPGADLTDLGIQQAEAAAKALAEHPIGGIFASSLVRTQQTVAPLSSALGLEVTVMDGIKEIQAGAYEMATDEDSILGYVGTVADWIEGRLDNRMKDSETGHEFLARYDAAVAEIVAAGHRTALLVSHGAAIRTWVANRVSGSEIHEMATAGFANTACIELDGRPEIGWQIVRWTSDPVGGAFLEDDAPDPTGQDIDENS